MLFKAIWVDDGEKAIPFTHLAGALYTRIGVQLEHEKEFVYPEVNHMFELEICEKE